jgi:hypothetical protein
VFSKLLSVVCEDVPSLDENVTLPLPGSMRLES